MSVALQIVDQPLMGGNDTFLSPAFPTPCPSQGPAGSQDLPERWWEGSAQDCSAKVGADSIFFSTVGAQCP